LTQRSTKLATALPDRDVSRTRRLTWHDDDNARSACICIPRNLTFELSGRQRQDARPGPVKMYTVPPDRAWWPAVGAPLERGVRHCPAVLVDLGEEFAAHGVRDSSKHSPHDFGRAVTGQR
jgi:hypothetical protein